MAERRKARSVRDCPGAQNRIEVDERETKVGLLVVQAETEARLQDGVANTTKERVMEVQVAIPHALGEAPRAMAALL
jgi:hypothetical protein